MMSTQTRRSQSPLHLRFRFLATRSPLLSILVLPFLFLACAIPGQNAYERALDQVGELPESAYYQHELERPVPQAVEESVETPGWVEELDALVQTQREQTQKEPESLFDFGSVQTLEYQKLAASEEAMNTRLAESPSLELLLNLAYKRNQGLQAAQQKVQAVLEQYPQAAYLNNVLAQYNAFTKQLDTKVGPTKHKEMVGMRFPSPGMLSIKSTIVTQDVQVMQKDVEIALRNLITDVRLAYYEYLFVHESLAITRENQELLELMVQIATTKFRASMGNYQSILKAQVALSRLSDSLLTLEERRETLRARLNTLLDRMPDARLGIPQVPDHFEVILSLDQLYELGVSHRQELQKQQLVIGKMELMIDMVQRMSTPDASTGTSYFEDRTGIRSGTDKMPMTFMNQRSVNPATAAWFTKDNAYTREVALKVDAMRQMIIDMEDKTRFMTKLHHFGANTAKRTVMLYEHTLIPQARQALDAANTAYQANKVDFLNLLDAQRTLLNFQLEQHKALWDHRMHTAQLEQVIGRRLPKQALELNYTEQMSDE